jgi:hypothetical protein
MKKILIAACTLAATLVAGTAHASGNVYWSVGVNVPNVHTQISNMPRHRYHHAPPPVVYYPAPAVVYQQPVVVYQPAPVYRPAPVVVVREGRGHRGHWKGHHGHYRGHHHGHRGYGDHD